MKFEAYDLFPDYGYLVIAGEDLVSQVAYELVRVSDALNKIGQIIKSVRHLYLHEFDLMEDGRYLKRFNNYNELMLWIKWNLYDILNIADLDRVNFIIKVCNGLVRRCIDIDFSTFPKAKYYS